MSGLFTKRVSASGCTRYVNISETEPVDTTLTDGQVLTMSGAIGMTLLDIHYRNYPEHKRNHRKIKAVHDAIKALYENTGAVIDDDTALYALECWNMAVKFIGMRDKL